MIQLFPTRETAQVTDILLLKVFTVQLVKCPQQFTADRTVIDEFLLKKWQTAWSATHTLGYRCLGAVDCLACIVIVTFPVPKMQKTGFAPQREIPEDNIVKETFGF